MPRRRITLFVLAYVGVFVALAACGYYAVDTVYNKNRIGHYPFATDMAYYDMPRLTIAVGGDDDSAPRLRADISLEVNNKDMDIVEGYQPHIAEKISAVLSTVKPEDLKRLDTLPGLREEMLRAVNSAGVPVPIHGLMFRELVIM